METATFLNNTNTRHLRNIEALVNTPKVEATPKERLHTVDGFIDKLEQAVLERL